MLSRRQFTRSLLSASMAAPIAAHCLATAAHGAQPRKKDRVPGDRCFSAFSLATLPRSIGHGLCDGWPVACTAPEIASIYIDQYNERDIGKQRLERYHMQASPTIEDALTLGGSKLAVDGVVIIGEHGNYPKNELGQTRYPRYEWFKKVVRVFEASGVQFRSSMTSTCRRLGPSARRWSKIPGG